MLTLFITQTTCFLVKKIARSLNIFFVKKTNDVINFPLLYIRPSLSRDHYQSDRCYCDKESETKISRKNMKNLLSKNVHFTFGNNIYQQKVGVAMGSPLGPVLAGIFTVHLERQLMQELEKFMKPWKRYADDTITNIKPDFITNVINILNKFHQNIKFTYKVEHNFKISF